MSEYICDLPIDGMASFVSGNTTIPVHEQVVRCKDCTYMHTVRSWLGMDVDECWLHAGRESGALGKERTEPDGYCAWGERRDE